MNVDNEQPQVFISHSSRDRSFVDKHVVALLNRHGIRTWYSPDDIQAMSQWDRVLGEGLKTCDWFLVVLSPNAVVSEWVKAEVRWAFRNRQHRIIPLLFQRCDSDELHWRMGDLQQVNFCQVSEAAESQLLSIWNKELDTPSKSDVEVWSARQQELAEAEAILRARQNLIVLGQQQSGKTTFCKLLIHRMMSRRGNTTLPTYLNLEQIPSIAVENVQSHVLAGMIGEISRQVFNCKYTTLFLNKVAPDLLQDQDFKLLRDCHRILYSRLMGERALPLTDAEFVRFNQHISEIIGSRGWQKRVVVFDSADRFERSDSLAQLVRSDDMLGACAVGQVFVLRDRESEAYKQLIRDIGFSIELAPHSAEGTLR